MNTRLLRAALCPAVWTWRTDGRHVRPAAVPDATDIVPWDDLCQPSGLDVPDLDEARIEEEDVRMMQRNAFGGAFPFNHS